MEKTKYRLIIDKPRSAAENMAIDEAILMKRSEIGLNTLRLYSWRPSAVSIGYFQSIERVLDIEKSRELGVDYVRRISGGGAVFHDHGGEITYSIVVDQDSPILPKRVVDSYPVLCDGVIRALTCVGLQPKFSGINDIVVNGKKISGNAQTRRYGGVLQHGTILRKVRPDFMFSLLKITDEKMRDKAIKNFHERVTSLEKEGILISERDLVDALILGFSQALNVRFVKTTLSKEERLLAEKLKEEKYVSKEWNHKK